MTSRLANSRTRLGHFSEISFSVWSIASCSKIRRFSSSRFFCTSSRALLFSDAWVSWATLLKIKRNYKNNRKNKRQWLYFFFNNYKNNRKYITWFDLSTKSRKFLVQQLPNKSTKIRFLLTVELFLLKAVPSTILSETNYDIFSGSNDKVTSFC